MTPSPHIAEAESASAAERARVLEILDRMAGADVEALAALAGAPAGVAELAFSAFPSGTRMWLITYDLATAGNDGALAITDLGRQAVELAAERCPQPYSDISLEDVMTSTQGAIGRLVEQSGVRIREPGTYPAREAVASAIRRTSRQLVERLQSSMVDWLESKRTQRRDNAGATEESVHAEESANAEREHAHVGH